MATIYNPDDDEVGDEWQMPAVTADSPFGDFSGPVPDVLAHMVSETVRASRPSSKQLTNKMLGPFNQAVTHQSACG
jgi:hypothetical protein